MPDITIGMPAGGESTPVLSRPGRHVALIELNRPSSANRIQSEDLEVLGEHLTACEADDDVRALVISARGTRFSAGFDLRVLSDPAAVPGRGAPHDGVSAFEAFTERLENTRLVTIAAINGPVVGGATDIALACDLRIGAAESASMSMPAARIGLPLYPGALQRYVTRLGINHAKRLVLLGQTIDAREMLEIGFVCELVAQDALLERALAIASDIATMPPQPIAAMKQGLNAAALGRANESARELRAAFDGQRTANLIEAARFARRTPAQGARRG